MKPGCMIPLVCCVFMAFIYAGSAFSAHPLITDDAYTQGKGSSQLELSGQYSFDKDTDVDSTKNSVAGEVVFAYGIIDSVDLVLRSAYEDARENSEGCLSRKSGISDTDLGIKWRFFEKKDVLSLSVKPVISFSTGDHEKNLGSGETGYRFFFISSAKWDPFSVHVNLGYIRNENRVDERRDIFVASLAGEWEFSDGWRLVADTGIETCRDMNHKEDPVFLLLGIIYSVTKSIDLDLGVKQGVTGTEDRFTLSGAVTFKF